ncbi:MAG: ribonuclease BN, partial [Myxococcales bacterium]|nr:ribonuclease BN [Myxococcales bacterium]
TLLFAMMFRILADIRIPWSDVWVGAAFTSLLFALGRFGISFYLGQSSGSSVYGAASSVIVILLWIYYSSQLLFFGAEFTQVYAHRFGSLRASSGAPL